MFVLNFKEPLAFLAGLKCPQDIGLVFGYSELFPPKPAGPAKESLTTTQQEPCLRLRLKIKWGNLREHEMIIGREDFTDQSFRNLQRLFALGKTAM